MYCSGQLTQLNHLCSILRIGCICCCLYSAAQKAHTRMVRYPMPLGNPGRTPQRPGILLTGCLRTTVLLGFSGILSLITDTVGKDTVVIEQQSNLHLFMPIETICISALTLSYGIVHLPVTIGLLFNSRPMDLYSVQAYGECVVMDQQRLSSTWVRSKFVAALSLIQVKDNYRFFFS